MAVSKRKSLYMILLSMVLTLGMLLTSCAEKPGNIEELVSSDEDIQQEIQSAAENAGMTVEIKGNEIIYSYDLASVEGATEEALKDEAMIKTLQSALDDQKSIFSKLCKDIETETEISGVTATVNYTYGDEVLATQTFSSADE